MMGIYIVGKRKSKTKERRLIIKMSKEVKVLMKIEDEDFNSYLKGKVENQILSSTRSTLV